MDDTCTSTTLGERAVAAVVCPCQGAAPRLWEEAPPPLQPRAPNNQRRETRTPLHGASQMCIFTYLYIPRITHAAARSHDRRNS